MRENQSNEEVKEVEAIFLTKTFGWDFYFIFGYGDKSPLRQKPPFAPNY